MRYGRVLIGSIALTLASVSCSSGSDASTTTAPVAASTTTTNPPLDVQAHAERLLAGIRSEGEFLQLDSPGVVTVGEGSGLVVATEGLLLTTATAVVGADRIDVYIPGEEFPIPGELEAAAECANLALVRVDHTFPAAAELEEAGAPTATASAVRSDIISGAASASVDGDFYGVEAESDVVAGGVLFDDDGGVAGIVTGFDAGGHPVAVRNDVLLSWVRQMRQRDVVQQLGFTAVANTEGQAVVAGVAEMGPGAELGLDVGDVVISADGDSISGGPEQLCTALADGQATLEVLKDGRRYVGAVPGEELTLASARSTDQIRQAVVEVGVPGGGTGSGFFISADGLLVTNYHVAGAETDVALRFDGSGDTISGKVIAASACADLALIQASPGSYQYLEWAPEAPQLEEPIRVIGFPNGTQAISFQEGIVAKEATPDAYWVGPIGSFETSAAIDFGSSGGPVVNEDGEVVGVTYAVASGASSLVQNSRHLVGVDAHDVVAGLLDGTVVDPGFSLIWDGWAESYEVANVRPGGPADELGLQAGDTLLEFDTLDRWEDFNDLVGICTVVQQSAPDAVHDVIVYRGSGVYLDGQLNGAALQERPDDFVQASEDGTISVSVPGTWTDYRAIEPSEGDDGVGFFAAPSVDAYFADWGNAPGLRVMWSTSRGEKYTTEDWFDAVKYRHIAIGEPIPLTSLYYWGDVQYFETPEGNLSLEYALREYGDGEGPLILVYVSDVDSLLDTTANDLLNSLYTELPLPPQPADL